MRLSVRSKLLTALTISVSLCMASCAGARYTPPTPSAPVTLTLSEADKAPCVAARLELLRIAGTEAFAAAQHQAFEACGSRFSFLVFAIETHNAILVEREALRQRENCLATRPWYAPLRRC